MENVKVHGCVENVMVHGTENVKVPGDAENVKVHGTENVKVHNFLLHGAKCIMVHITQHLDVEKSSFHEDHHAVFFHVMEYEQLFCVFLDDEKVCHVKYLIKQQVF